MNVKVKIGLLFICFSSSVIFAQNKDYVITNFGAIADGVTNNAAAIQRAIDQVNIDGGGKVIVPQGNFVCSFIFLKSNVELHIALGARLLGSVNIEDYYSVKSNAIISSKEQKNISVTGEGIIDGQASELVKDIFIQLQAGKIKDSQWEYKRPTEVIRPKLIEFIECEEVKIKNIKLINASGWVQNYSKCSNLEIDNIKVESTAYWNNDGLDVTDCKNVVIKNCFINSADDGICLKSEDPNFLCEDVFVSNCIIRSSANAFKLGTSSKGGFKNIKARNLTVYDTYRSAVAIEMVDGGLIENIDVEGVTAKNTGNAVFIRLGQRNTTGSAGSINGIRIANLKAEIPLRKPDLGYPMEGPPDHLRGQYLKSPKERPNLGYPATGLVSYPYNLIPSSIVGIPNADIKNVLLENIEIIFGGAGRKDVACISMDSLQKVPEKMADYPEFSMFGELPAWGFYVRHVDGIKFKNVQLKYENDDFRPALVFDDVEEVELNNVVVASGKELPIVVFNKVEKEKIVDLSLPVNNSKGIKEQ